MKEKNVNNLNLILVIGIFMFIGCVCPAPNEKSEKSDRSQTSIQNRDNSEPNAKNSNSRSFDYEKDGLQLISSKWEKGGFGTIAIWKVTIKNVSDKPLGDIKFSTEYYSETENVVGKGGTKGLIGKDTIQKIVPPKSTRTFEVNDGFVSDEAASANFQIESWRIVE